MIAATVNTSTVLVALGLVGAAVAAGLALWPLSRRTTSLRLLVLVIVLASLAIGAMTAVALARLMVLEDGEASAVLVVLGATALLSVVLALVASSPLGRDARRVEEAVRRVEAGERDTTPAVVRADELGHVARALAELTDRLATLERERATFDEERRRMLSSIGHDLRTPLAALRAAIEALADGVAPDPDRYLRAMVHDVEALGSLVDDLFLLARIEAGRLDLEREPVDLAELVEAAVESLAPTAASAGVGVHILAPHAVPVRANATALGRVVRNLLDNAIRHAPAGSVVQVEVLGGSQPSVRVLDEGPGFPPGFADEAFERFARADPSRNRATGGAGLGLAIARGLVEAHGGRIWIEPADGGRVAFDIAAR